MNFLLVEITLYVVLGLVAVFINIPVIVTVFWSPQLRFQKEFVLIAGLCISDAVNGIGFCLPGLYRMDMVIKGLENETFSRFDCLMTVAQSLSVAVDQAFGWMLLVVTLDRFHAVYRPIKYFKLTHWYAWKILGAVVCQSILCLILAYIFTFDDTIPEVSSLCYTSDSVDPDLYRCFEITRIVVVTCSVLLYVPITLKLYTVTIAKQRELGHYSNRRYQQLKNMTITVALSSASAVTFVLIPDSFITFKLFGVDEQHGFYLFTLILAKSSINVLIYVLRNPVLKCEMKKILKCRKADPPVTPASTVYNSTIPSARKTFQLRTASTVVMALN